MRKGVMATLMLGTALILAGCGDDAGGAAAELEKGQVVATVGGQDITIHELNAELQGVALPTGERRKAIEQAALQQIVNRRILADIARERGIDETPAFVLQKKRTEEALLVQLLQQQLASKIQPPTREQADAFIRQNPNLFAERKVFTIDQIQFEQPEDLRTLAAFEPLQTMDEVESKLIQDGVEYRRLPATLDAVGANPELIAQVLKLPPGEVFLIPTGRAVLANRVTDTRVEPFTGDRAVQYAMQILQQQKLATAAGTELDATLKKARDEVQYQKGYAPPEPKQAPGAAPAAPGAAPAPGATPAPAATTTPAG